MKELRALQTRKGRAESGRFIAEGVRVVEDLLVSRVRVCWVLVSSSLEDSERGRRLLDAVRDRGAPLRTLSDRDFGTVAATEHPQGVLAVAEIPRAPLDSVPLGGPRCLVLVLDAVQDPGNFGTLARSAEALGAAAVIALPGSVDPWNPKTVRAAVGSTFRVPVLQMEVAAAVAGLRAAGFRLLGAERGGGAVAEARSDRIALFVGNEGAGLSEEVRAAMDGMVEVPLRGRAESLNVGAAAAILLYELGRPS